MRSKTLILLVLALGCGLVASIGISQVLQRQDQTPAGDTAPVWVVMMDIKRSDPLTMQNLKLEQWPKDKIPAGAAQQAGRGQRQAGQGGYVCGRGRSR